MGNQQATKLKPKYYMEGWDALQISPGVYIPRKRRRQVEEASNNLGGTPGSGRRRKCQIVDLQATDKTSQRGTGREREEARTSSELLKPVWKAKLPRDSPESLQRTLSIKSHFSSSRKILSSNAKSCLTESDTDLSEYDNGMYSVLNLNTETQNSEIAGWKHEKEKTKEADTKPCQDAAAQRVIGKIKEVEEILRQVSLTSSNWITDGHEEDDSFMFASSEVLQQVTCWLEDQNRASAEEAGKLCAHDNAQSLNMTWTKARKSEDKDQTKMKTSNFHDFNCPLTSHIHSYSVSGREDRSLAPSPTFSTSSSLESLSPILSSPLTSSLTNMTDWQNADVSKRKKEMTDSEKELWDILEAQGCKKVTTNPWGAEKDLGPEEEKLMRSTLQLKEDYLLSSDEALQRQEEIWQQEVEESLSRCRSLFHPSRPKHVDFLHITAPDDEVTEFPLAEPLHQLT
ncbi:PREDICTED: uncharacterized protein LOC107093658, partial [Cyprinodon variegatus]|uniref:uncharacterized protein LOC107093658 n=1 Tax=Cyprinodon variegatus TaxID=28743 RepID=UPI000742C828